LSDALIVSHVTSSTNIKYIASLILEQTISLLLECQYIITLSQTLPETLTLLS